MSVIPDQRVSLVYRSPADSNRINERFTDIRPPGIYQGGWLINASSGYDGIKLTPFVCEIKSLTDPDKHQVRIDTRYDENFQSVGELIDIPTPTQGQLVILRWEYKNDQVSQLEVLCASYDEIEDTDLIVGVVNGPNQFLYDGIAVDNSILQKSYRSIPNTPEYKLKIEDVSEYYSNSVMVLRGYILTTRTAIPSTTFDPDEYLTQSFFIKTTLLNVPGTQSFFVYINKHGSVITHTGNMVGDALKGTTLLGLVYMGGGRVQHIEDMRSFASPSLPSYDYVMQMYTSLQTEVQTAIAPKRMVVRYETTNEQTPQNSTPAAWTAYPLNEEQYNSITDASLSNFQLTLPAGIYSVDGDIWGIVYGYTDYANYTMQTRIANAAGTTVHLQGGVYGANTARYDRTIRIHANIKGIITLTTPTVCEFQYYTKYTVELGVNGDGSTENIHGTLCIEKIA